MIYTLTFLRTATLSIVALILVVFFSSTSLADDREDPRALVEAGDIMPLEFILEQLQKRTSGRVIEVELERKHGRFVYEIEQIEEQGVVREYTFDASNGNLLKEKVED